MVGTWNATRNPLYKVLSNTTPVVISPILLTATGISLSTNEAKGVFAVGVCKFSAGDLL
jgi:hypothetical protein